MKAIITLNDVIRHLGNYEHVNYSKNGVMSDGFVLLSHTSHVDLGMVELNHRMTNMVLGLCLSGKCNVNINGREYTIKKNSLIVLYPGDVVKTSYSSPDFGSHMLLVDRRIVSEISLMQPDMLNFMCYTRQHPITELSDKARLSIDQVIRNTIERNHLENGRYEELVLRSYVNVLFYELCNYMTETLTLARIRHNRKEMLFVRFLGLVAANYRNERFVDYYAQKMCVTQKYLSVVVKELSGQRPKDIIENRLIQEAKNMLSNTNYSIQEIAETLNFVDQSTFGKYFKRFEGITPTAYRNKRLK